MLASNHPQLAGGSHLPDITVITPVFSEGKIVFFVASRGHHADVGGITPGSMPPNSHSLVEEGAAILSFKLVRKGAFQVRLARLQCASVDSNQDTPVLFYISCMPRPAKKTWMNPCSPRSPRC